MEHEESLHVLYEDRRPTTRDLESPSCPILCLDPRSPTLAWEAWAGWAQAHLGHGSVQDNSTLLGEGLLGAQQVVYEQGDAGKTVAF